MTQQNLPIHPRERFPYTAPQVLDSSPKVDLQFGRFFITEEEFNLRLNAICFDVFRFFVYVFNHGICRS